MESTHVLRAALLCSWILSAAGCSPELSKVPGVSIRRAPPRLGFVPQRRGWADWHGSLCTEISNNNRKQRVISTVDLTDDFDVCTPSNEPWSQKVQLAREQTEYCQLHAVYYSLGLRVMHESRAMPVLVLRPAGDRPAGLRPSPPGTRQHCEQSPPLILSWSLIGTIVVTEPHGPVRYSLTAWTMEELARAVECNSVHFGLGPNSDVVLNEVPERGRFDFELTVDWDKGMRLGDALGQIGLALTPETREVQAIYVDPEPQAEPGPRLRVLKGRPHVFPAWDKPRDPPDPPEAPG